MYQVETAEQRNRRCQTRVDVLYILDAECRRRYDQAVKDPAGPADDTFRYGIRGDTGRPIAWLTYSPCTERPYKTVVLGGMLAGGR